MGLACNGATHCILSNNEDGIGNSCEEKKKKTSITIWYDSLLQRA